MTIGSSQRTRGEAQDLRIALFCANYAGVTDGASKTLHRLVDFLRARGAAVRVYSAAAATADADVVKVPSVVIPGRSEYRLSLGLTRPLRDDVRSFRPTHIHISVPDLLGMQAQRFSRRLGIPIVASMHTRFETYLAYYRLGFLRSFVERRLARFYRGCDLVLVPNEAIAEEFRARGWATSIHVWPRGVDRRLFHPGRRSVEWRRTHGFRDDDVVLLFFGRLVREKGIELFVAAIEQLRSRGIEAPVLIVGDGPERIWLERRLPYAIFAGHLAGKELATAVASADVLVNPSTTEAFGNVNLEAMSSGLALVSANAPSARALMEHGKSGLLVEGQMPKAYADAAEELILSPVMRRELAVTATDACEAFDWDQLLGDVAATYALLPTASSDRKVH